MNSNQRKSIINRAKEIEYTLNKYRLWGNMIPQGTWYNNLRKVLPRVEWDRIRKLVYKRQNYHCAICNLRNKLHCHEHWDYDYENGIQRLQQLVALCELCHMSQHLGFCQVVLIPKGQLSWLQLADHWGKVNEKVAAEFYSHKKLAFELWRLRSKLDWKLLDMDGKEITTEYQSMQHF